MNLCKRQLLVACSVFTSGCLHLTLHHPPPVMPPLPDYAPLAVVRIEPTREWTETTVTVRKGERLIIQADGEIRWTTPDRHTSPDGKGWSSFGVGAGGLVGRVDDGKAFDVGARTHLFPSKSPRGARIPFVPPALRMKRDGKLFFGFKSWKPGKFDGAFTVTIWREP